MGCKEHYHCLVRNLFSCNVLGGILLWLTVLVLVAALGTPWYELHYEQEFHGGLTHDYLNCSFTMYYWWNSVVTYSDSQFSNEHNSTCERWTRNAPMTDSSGFWGSNHYEELTIVFAVTFSLVMLSLVTLFLAACLFSVQCCCLAPAASKGLAAMRMMTRRQQSHRQQPQEAWNPPLSFAMLLFWLVLSGLPLMSAAVVYYAGALPHAFAQDTEWFRFQTASGPFYGINNSTGPWGNFYGAAGEDSYSQSNGHVSGYHVLWGWQPLGWWLALVSTVLYFVLCIVASFWVRRAASSSPSTNPIEEGYAMLASEAPVQDEAN
ncbi:hypothetical protein QOT17_011030 [Balamuthia mandrillaris]